MDKRSIVRRLEQALDFLEAGKVNDAMIILNFLIDKLTAVKDDTAELNKKLQHLMGWYLKLWNDKPPEALRFVTYKELLGKHFKELIQIYERNGETIDDLKTDYEEYRKKATAKKGTGGLLEFRLRLPKIKAMQGKKEDRWCLDNARGEDYYFQHIKSSKED